MVLEEEHQEMFKGRVERRLRESNRVGRRLREKVQGASKSPSAKSSPKLFYHTIKIVLFPCTEFSITTYCLQHLKTGRKKTYYTSYSQFLTLDFKM